jgi:hypothetical protein
MPQSPVIPRYRGWRYRCGAVVAVVGLGLLVAGLLVRYAATHRQPPPQPPDFQVVSYDTPVSSESACLVAAVVQNRGGPGSGLLTVTVADQASGTVLATCSAQIPSTGMNHTSKAECLLSRQTVSGRAADSMDVKVAVSNAPP